MDFDQKKQFIEEFSFDNCERGNQGYNRVLLQLFGYIGNGKSSFINTCKYVMDGKFQLHAHIGDFMYAGTTFRRSYPLTQTITLVDNRGCRDINSSETGEVLAQLGNLLPLDQEVTFTAGYQNTLHRIMSRDSNPSFTDFITPIFVYSVSKSIARQEIPHIRQLIENTIKVTGIVPFVVLTNMYSGNLEEIKTIFKNMAITKIYQVDNYTAGNTKKIRETHEEVVKILYEVLQDVHFRMKDKRNPENEKAERMEIVLNIIHESEVQREREKVKQELREQELENKESIKQKLKLRLQEYEKQEIEKQKAKEQEGCSLM